MIPSEDAACPRLFYLLFHVNWYKERREYEKRVRATLGSYGCFFIRHGKGDHDIWYSPITERNVTVPATIKSRYTANSILKQCGIDRRF